jgi:hypothetical protein
VSNISLSVNGTLKDKDSSVGTAGQILSSTGTKVQWINLPVYTATTPLNINSTTKNISIQKADSTQDGYLSSLDWITFDGKQNAISLTTTGSSGPATLVGSTLNIPNYGGALSGYVPTSRTLTINGVTYDLSADRTWTIGAGVSSVSATSPLFSTGGPTPIISIQKADSVLDGYLSSTDWITFNSKQSAGNYITSLTGEATGVGPGATAVTLSNAAVIGKVLTGLNITGGTVVSTDSILTAFGKVQNQINGLVGGVVYKGVWDASTNTPTLTSSVGTQGWYYVVSVAGNTNLNGITSWNVGDWAIFNGSTWNKVDNTDAVTSVNGQTGAVSLTTDNIPEGTTNLYYLDSRARAALSFAAGSGAYNSTTGVITIPTNTSQLTNGANFITLSSLTASSPLSYNNTTGAFSISQATTATDGYLSSTDWNTFNGKQSTISLTTTGSSGSSTLIGSTLNVPTYTLAGLGGVPTTRTLTINGVTYDLSADRSWTINSMIYPSAGIAVSTGTAWATSITDNSSDWNTAYSLRITSATTPLNITSNVLSISQSSGSTNGYLSSTDWTTFNNKQAFLNGTGLVKSVAGTISYITDNSTNWNTAYDNMIVSAAVTGTSTKTLTLNQQDGGTIQASWSDADTGLTSIGLSMPSAFTVSNSPLTSNGTIGVTGAGLASQYVRGDGTLANFPTNGGGGSSVNYYLNGSINQGTFGGTTYYQMSKTPIIGAGTNFTRTNGQGNGYIASFITDAGDPSLLNIPGGNWNLEFYFNSSSTGGSPSFYGEIYKVSASNVFTLIASGATNPEEITNGTSVDQYFTSVSVPQTSLLVTDRLAIRIYVITDGRTITLHTEDNNLSEVLTTISTGLTALNGLTAQVQYFQTGTSGTDFNINSLVDTHTFNLPTASATNRGALSSTDWTTFNSKQPAIGYTPANDALVVHLAGNETITGVKTFSVQQKFDGSLALKEGVSGTLAGYTVLGANVNQLIVGLVGASHTLAFPSSTNYTYTFPSATGTLALVGGAGVGTVTSVAALTLGTSGTDLSSTVANSTTTPVITLNVPTASATNRGALSSTDWTTFNNKQNALTNPITGTGTSGQVTYFNGTSSITSSSNLAWDGTNLTIGTPPSALANLHVYNASAAASFLLQTNSTTDYSEIAVRNDSSTATSYFRQYSTAATGSDFGISRAGLALFFSNYATNFAIGTRNGGSLIFGTADTERMRVTSVGNVGIGIATTRTVSGYTFLAINGSTKGGFTDYYYNGTLTGSVGAETNLSIVSQNANGIDFITPSSSYSTKLSIANSGAATFSSSVTVASYLKVFNTSYPSTYATSLRSDSGATGVLQLGNNDINYILAGNTAAGGYLSIRVNCASESVAAGTEAMRITNTGNVGIGTSSPGSLLTLYATTTPTIAFQNSGAVRGYLSADSGNNIYNAVTGNGHVFQCDSTERIRITSLGQLQIKQGADTYSYGYRMINSFSNRWSFVNGGDNNLYYGYNEVDKGVFNNSTGAYTTLSDINKKKDFEDSIIGLNAILGLKPTLFRMKDEEGTEKHLGFIAQEVKEFIPQAYSENKNGDNIFIGLTEMPIIAALVKAIQEQQAQIEELKVKIK